MDFQDFEDNDIDSIVANIKKLSPLVTLQGIVTTNLKYICKFMGYLIQCQILLKPEYLKWDTIKYFGLQWKFLQDKKDKLSDIKLPKPGKNLPMIKWIPNDRTKCDSMIGSRGAPIGYVCDKPDYSNAAHDFMQDDNSMVLPFTEDCGCVAAVSIQ